MPQELIFNRTRLAPTPSGYLHLGNAFSFALTAALAKTSGASLLLRIDDMDRERVTPAYVQDVFDTLNFLQIDWQEGPRTAQEFEQQFSQLHRMELYKQTLEKLKNNGLVYACSCSRAQVLRDSPDGNYAGTCRHKNIPLDAEDVCWRLDTSVYKNLSVKTLHGDVSAQLPLELHDVVIRKKDGFPAYQLSSVIDDLHFGVDLIVRGQDLWPCTLVQLYLAELLGLEKFLNVTFHHHPLLNTNEGKKLSKSAGHTSVKYLREHGKTVENVYEMLGNFLGTKTTLHSLEEFSEQARALI